MARSRWVRVWVMGLWIVGACGTEDTPGSSMGPGADVAGSDAPTGSGQDGQGGSGTGQDAVIGDSAAPTDAGPDAATAPDGGPGGTDVTGADSTTGPDAAPPQDALPSGDADALPPPENSCCETSELPGCVDPGIMECVCTEVAVCCQQAWTGKCVDAANILCHAGCGGGGVVPVPGAECGDGACDPEEDCGSCPGDCGFCAGSGGCCDPHGSTGCADLAITQCVCGVDEYCCSTAWDELCVSEAGADCGAGCQVGPTCGDGSCDAGEGCDDCPSDCGVCDPGDCCTPRATPGCGAPGIETCVCEADPFCCETAWDSLCVLGAKDTCGAPCATPNPTCGDGVCDASEGCAACPADCGPCGGGDCCAASTTPGCADPGVQACVCGKDSFCCTSVWDDLCAGAAAGCGAVCGGGTCECGWAPAGCGPQSGVLEVVPLDVWAQTIPGSTVAVTAPPAGMVSSEGGAVWHIPLCGNASLGATVSAPLHDALTGTLTYDGKGGVASMTFKPAAGAKAAWTLTQDVRNVGGKQVRYFTLHAGLAHGWFAPSGRPARRGTRVTLLRDGEQAWATVTAELGLASKRVMASSWWWTSQVELVRDPATHMFLSPEERWKNTIMGRLEALPGVERRVMVNQFYSQDGLLSDITVDDELLAKAKVAGDDFEFMGQANEAHGKFVIKPSPVDFAARVAAAGAAPAGSTVVASAPFPAFSGPISVDTTALPLGIGWLDLPVASWHQKFAVIDTEVAFIGGMNFKTTDWDTSKHTVYNELRMQFDATTADRQKVKAKKAEPDFGPRKDYMMRVEGPAAVDAENIFRERWSAQLAADALYADQSTPFAAGKMAAPLADGVQAQVISTMPAPFSETAILEALLRAVDRAEKYIYIEDQYFRAPLLMDHVIARMKAAPNLVLIVVTNPMAEWSDPGCWQTYTLNQKLAAAVGSRYRTYRTQSFDAVDTGCTFCIDEVDAHFVPHDLHSKIVLIDDVWMEIGSCNSNNRGLLYEGELAVAVYDPATVSKARDDIFGNILGKDYKAGTAPSKLIEAFDARAKKNDAVWQAWDKDGMDLDLDGDPIPSKYLPDGFLYPLQFGAPSDCFIEGVGPDVT